MINNTTFHKRKFSHFDNLFLQKDPEALADHIALSMLNETLAQSSSEPACLRTFIRILRLKLSMNLSVFSLSLIPVIVKAMFQLSAKRLLTDLSLFQFLKAVFGMIGVV